MKKLIFTGIYMMILLVSLNTVFSTQLLLNTNESIVNSFYIVQERSDDLVNSGLPALETIYLTKQADLAFKSRDYSKLKDIVLQLDALNEKITNIDTGISSADTKISGLLQLEINMSAEESSLVEIRSQFEYENYDIALQDIETLTRKLNTIIWNKTSWIEDSLRTQKEKQLLDGLEVSLINKWIENISSSLDNRDYSSIILIRNNYFFLNASIDALNNLHSISKKINQSNMSTNRLDNYMDELVKALDYQDFESAMIIIDETDFLTETISQTQDLMATTNQKISEYSYLSGIDQVNQTYNLAEQQFQSENYEEAGELMQSSYDLLTNLEAQSLLFGTLSVKDLQERIIDFFTDPLTIINIVSIFILFLFLYKRVKNFIIFRISKIQIEKLEQESKTIKSLIKRTQFEYFIKALIDKETYESAIKNHQERLVRINERAHVLKKRVERVKK